MLKNNNVSSCHSSSGLLIYISAKFKNILRTIQLKCVTELQLLNLKIIQCHPNFQGEGEWSDWILERCGNSHKKLNGKMIAFQPECHDRESPARVMMMIIILKCNFLL